MPDQGPFWMLLDGSVEYHHPGTPHAQLLPVRLEGTKNTSMAIRGAAQVQEAHFFVLTMVASRAEVREGSVLWQLIQSLPPLISATAPEGAERVDGAILHFTKKTAIELLGHLAEFNVEITGTGGFWVTTWWFRH